MLSPRFDGVPGLVFSLLPVQQKNLGLAEWLLELLLVFVVFPQKIVHSDRVLSRLFSSCVHIKKNLKLHLRIAPVEPP